MPSARVAGKHNRIQNTVMYDEDELFGHDGRYKPPRADLLTSRWQESCIGRLAYAQMVRTHETNVSEYAVRTMGGVPKGYVIVNAQEVPYRKDTALKVAHNRVAIPVKEYAKHRHLTPREQWELMNPKWVGTFFGFLGEDPYRNRRPSLEQAIDKAMEDDRYDEFMRQFWSPEYEHKDAVDRLTGRMRNLQCEADALRNSLRERDKKITMVVHDIENQRLERYHLQGYNAHEYLSELRCKRNELYKEMMEAQQKADSIREYLKNISF